jgi:hypothetical protein
MKGVEAWYWGSSLCYFFGAHTAVGFVEGVCLIDLVTGVFLLENGCFLLYCRSIVIRDFGR